MASVTFDGLAAASSHSHGNPTLNLTNITGTTASASNGLTLSLSAANQAFSADAMSNFQTLVFQNSNGVSFSNNAGSLRVTHDLQFTSATSAITANALNTSASRVINVVAATNNTGGGTASLSSNVSFSAANGFTFYTSAGGAIVGSNAITTARASTDAVGLNTALTANGVAWTVNSSGLSLNVPAFLTTARASTDAVGLNTAKTNVTWTVNSSGLSFDAGGYAGTATTFAGTNVSASITHNSAGLNLALSAPAGTINQTGPNIGVSNLGNTLGSTQTVSTGNVVLAGVSGITLSQSTGAANSNATITIIGQNIGTMSQYAPPWMYSGAATNSSLGQSSLYMQPFEVGHYLSASRIQFFVSLSGALSNGNSTGTCSAGIGYALYTLGTGASTDRLMTLTSYSMPIISQSMNSNTQYNATHYIGLSNATSHSTSQVGLTNANASTYQASSVNGLRAVNMPANITMTPGRYYLGVSVQTVTGNAMTNGISVLHTAANLWPEIVAWGTSSSATNASNWRPMQAFGTYSAQSGGWPDTIPFTTDAIRHGVSQTMVHFNILGYATATNLM